MNGIVDFADVLADAQARLADAVHDRDAAMHSPVVATGDGDARIMVLRAADPDLAALRFHTDWRSPKVAIVAVHPRVTVLAYDPAARVQLRLIGRARILREGDQADAAWDATGVLGRRCYLANAGPGAERDGPGSALPADLAARRPTLTESEAGRANFAVMLVQVDAVDWLHLARDGGTRARLTREGAGWWGEWIAP